MSSRPLAPTIPGMTCSDVKRWMGEHKLDTADLAQATGVTVRTANYWQVRMPPWYLRAVLDWLERKL